MKLAYSRQMTEFAINQRKCFHRPTLIQRSSSHKGFLFLARVKTPSLSLPPLRVLTTAPTNPLAAERH